MKIGVCWDVSVWLGRCSRLRRVTEDRGLKNPGHIFSHTFCGKDLLQIFCI